MVVFEQFKLAELKDVIIYVRKKFNLFLDYKVYHMNKFDLISVMRNSSLFDETKPIYLYFSCTNQHRKKFTAKFQPKPTKRYYKGEKLSGIRIRNFDKPITISFN